MTVSLATPGERAGLLAAIFIVAYLAFSIPVLIAGVATTKLGLHSTALAYSASIAVLVAAAVGILVLHPVGAPARPAPDVRAVMPPGPCTVPPCLQALNSADRSPARSPVRQSVTASSSLANHAGDTQ